jgi:hypothetical protein
MNIIEKDNYPQLVLVKKTDKMRKHIFTTFAVILFLTLVFDLSAQKVQIKSMLHKQYTPNNNGELTLSTQVNKEYNQSNKVSLQEYSSLSKNNELQLDRQQRFSYDTKGRHQNTLEYNGDGILQAEMKLYWDEYDNKSKEEQIKYDNGQQTSVAVTYLLEYDSEGNKNSEQFFNQAGNPIKGRTWYYNKQKEISKSFTWLEDKKEPRKEIYTIYKRNKDGDLKQSTTTEKVNGKVFRKDVRYFSNNYVIEWKKYIEGKLESNFINEYRDSVIIRTTRKNKRKVISLEDAAKEKERLAKRKSKNNKKIKKGTDLFVTNTEYDTYGNILVTTQSVNEKVITVTQYAYDDVGNRVKTIKIDKEKKQKDEEILEHDDWGNISKCTKKKNDKILSEDYYVYEYYHKD